MTSSKAQSRSPLSPLAEELRRTIKSIGPCTGLEAWQDIGRRLTLARRMPQMGAPELGDVQLIGVDTGGVPCIRRADLDAALIEAERAGGLTCRNLRESGATQIYTWHPLAAVAEAEPRRQMELFGG